MTAEKKENESLTFEENIAKLNEIVKLMESDQLTLNELTSNYIQALGLIDSLHEQIDQAKQQIEAVQQKRSQ
ncbi:exodeoxyribonuclease VII small subunit [Psittacicella melopsittaci]|uniref:Exodeoxyribonuclease VII small subunit n=1 Tax=Psittacicella melopsittaci TaxID=2028576 RepID=A0A3A1Y8G8_9GAMM|nr:exodeoxyribonuclease VII small subunit [Psittacicella melopsittaci]RIY32414.1 exodeoxyribonuclease VII small subunit [Psittacicella melopsittaci]